MPYQLKPKSPKVIILGIFLLAIASVSAFQFARAGSLTPGANPASSMYTLSDIYTRLTTNATATEGGHSFSPAGSPASSMRSLKEIYDAIPTIVAGTVKSGTTYLGVLGTMLGDTDGSKVLTSASAPGTYNATNLTAGNVKSGITFGVSSTGSLTPDGGTAGVADLFSGKTANLTNDWTLDTGTLNLACNTSTFNGTANKVSDAYDGVGNGNNRWCMTDSGTATAMDIVSGKIAWVNGLPITGSLVSYLYGDSNAANVLTSAAGAGTYNATNLNANTVKSGTTFGVGQTGAFFGDTSQSKVLVSANAAGTALANLYNGTGQGFTGGTQASAGVDDYNNAGSPTTGRYTGGWTQCSAGNNYCGTGSTAADARDDSTGLVWSLPCNGSACATFSDSSPATYTWDSSGANNGGKTASQLCADAGWNLPHQKQLMMAYIDGSYGNLEASGVNRNYWSGTTVSDNTGNAWRTYLSNGSTNGYGKTTTNYVRCVRFSLGN
jgi:hypothetical protein